MRWLLRLLFLRLLGRRAVPILALLGLVRAIRGNRTPDAGRAGSRTVVGEGASWTTRR